MHDHPTPLSGEQLVLLEALSRATPRREIAVMLRVPLSDLPQLVRDLLESMDATTEIQAVSTAVRRGLI